ncbi:MAG: hypothetical protein IJ489_02090 [Clostridia bacterium]|nr:hypothetical protein [Clostridia bacterium]
MKIKTRESLRDIRVFDKTKDLSERTRSGIGEFSKNTESSQSSSANDYASNFVSEKAERIGKSSTYAADRAGQMGVRETQKNISNLKNRPHKVKKPKTKANVPKRLKSAGKNTVKTSERIKQTVKRLSKGVVKAAKAVVSAIKVMIASTKSIVAAIVAGGWVAVVVILVICLVAAIAGSVYAIFLPPAGDSGMTLQNAVRMIENEYYETRDEMISGYDYDVIHYNSELATWKEMIAFYAVKLNLDTENPTELATFNEEKADELQQVFWDMNRIQIHTEAVDEVRSTTFIDEYGNVSTVETVVEVVHLYVNTEITSIVNLCEIYGFTEVQREMLAELMSDENDLMWEPSH